MLRVFDNFEKEGMAANLNTLQKASWPEWGHVQERSILMVWPADIMQHCTITAEIFDKQIGRFKKGLNRLSLYDLNKDLTQIALEPLHFLWW